jgi:putative membrane protein
VSVPAPYCGTAPAPGELLARFNLDPILITALLAVGFLHMYASRTPRERACAAAGWCTAAAALVSPLCALSVALFSARIAQHMILLLVSAPLIALAWPPSNRERGDGILLYGSAGVFLVCLWGWHMPAPYDATFSSTILYWSMHLSLFGSATLLWRELLHHRPDRTAHVLVVGLSTSMQMGLLGAVLALAGHPLFFAHLTTTAPWGLTALQDQQLGGTLMWVPGIALFLYVALRSLHRLWSVLDGPRAA